jgi:hypothetical protein
MGATAARLALVTKTDAVRANKSVRRKYEPSKSEDAQWIIISEAHYLFDSVRRKENHEPILSLNDIIYHIRERVERIMYQRCRRRQWNMRIDFMTNSLRKEGSGFCLGGDVVWRMNPPAATTKLPRGKQY